VWIFRLYRTIGLHFQKPPYEQGKLVRVIKGRVLDVVLDLRAGSATFGTITYLTLTDHENNMLYIPPGFAHGFSALEDSIFSYKCTSLYNPGSEGGINPLDSDLAIDWQVSHPIISDKDLKLIPYSDFVTPF
jgi:dTDP-4-dehydrorhamnose 3,5-epimerase